MILDAILLGGGLGERFSGPGDKKEMPKQFQLLGNVPVFIHAIRGLSSLGCLRQVIFTVPKPYLTVAQEMLDAHLETSTVPIRVIKGGKRRQDSARLALELIEAQSAPPPTRVLIHDAARPFLSKAFLSRLRERLMDRSYGAWVPVTPVTETLKRVENQRIVETIDRQTVQRSQTPQIFEYTVIRSLAERARDIPDVDFTDDASICEYFGIPVGVFEGDVHNIKLTYQFELETLQSFITWGAAPEKKADSCALESDSTFTD